MGLDPAAPALPLLLVDEEPSAAWVAAALGVSLEDADWLLICYRFADPDAWRPVYVCEPL